MTSDSIYATGLQPDAGAEERLFDNWFDPIESAVRDRVRSFIEELIEGELETVLARARYGRRAKDSDRGATAEGVVGHRHGRRTRRLTGTFGQTEIAVPRARLMQPDDGTTEWTSAALRAYQRRTLAAEALIAGAYLAGVNTRRVRRALAALFSGAVGKSRDHPAPGAPRAEGRRRCATPSRRHRVANGRTPSTSSRIVRATARKPCPLISSLPMPMRRIAARMALSLIGRPLPPPEMQNARAR